MPALYQLPQLVMTCLYPMEMCVLRYDVMALKPLSANYKLRNGDFRKGKKERMNVVGVIPWLTTLEVTDAFYLPPMIMLC